MSQAVPPFRAYCVVAIACMLCSEAHAALSAAAEACTTNVYVATQSGNDANTGCASSAAVKTLPRAQYIARMARAAAGQGAHEITVWLDRGVYVRMRASPNDPPSPMIASIRPTNCTGF